jgi:hypothetical protein
MSRRRKDQSGSSFQAALAVANSEGYLGNSEIVEGLVRDFVANVIEATSPDTAFSECDRMALIFSGNEPGFTPIPEWNTREALGMKCADWQDVDPNQSLIDILRATFAKYAIWARSTVADYANEPNDDWRWRIDLIIEYCTSLMLGTIDTVFPQEPDEPPAAAHDGGADPGQSEDHPSRNRGATQRRSGASQPHETSSEEVGYHWANDRYFTDALAAWYRRRDRGLRFITIDMQALDRVAFIGSGPAYKLLEAMCSVERYEGWEGAKGAPRVLFATLLRMAEISGTTDRIPKTRRSKKDEPEGP